MNPGSKDINKKSATSCGGREEGERGEGEGEGGGGAEVGEGDDGGGEGGGGTRWKDARTNR